MRDWRSHWKEATRVPSDDIGAALGQVGKTTLGVPVEVDQLSMIIERILVALSPSAGDRVVDLGCGNGLITTHIADHVAFIHGFDISPQLIEDAKAYRAGPNVHYDVADLTSANFLRGDSQRSNKAYSYEVFQYFAEAEVATIFNELATRSSIDLLFVGSVPSREHIDMFYDTPARRKYYEDANARDEEQIGTWWAKERLAEIASDHGFSCEIRDQNPELYTSHYRFDATFARVTDDV